MVQITPRVIPDAYEFFVCLTQNTEWTPPEDGFYRVTCIGAGANGSTGGNGSTSKESIDGNHYYKWFNGGSGGSGGGAGGIARSMLELQSSVPVHCTVTNAISSFGNHLSATAGSGVNGGAGSGGNDFNTVGNNGGSGGWGGWVKTSNYLDKFPSSQRQPSAGNQGAGNGARGGSGGSNVESDIWDSVAGGGGAGGGGTYKLPDNISFDDPLYTTYISLNLSGYSGGNAGGGPSYYPPFSSTTPIWYGGGNGGGGGNSSGRGVGGSPGSPGGILIEKGVFH